MIIYFIRRFYLSSPSISLYDRLTDVNCRSKPVHFRKLLDHSFFFNSISIGCTICFVGSMYDRCSVDVVTWASYQIRNIAGCACAGNARNVFPTTVGWRSRQASRHAGDARAVMHAGIANYRFPFKLVARKTFPAFLAHAQPAILRIC